jgi:aspartate racemase
MRKLGLIGGMSWVSTELYYRRINSQIQKKLGGYNNAHLLIESVNFNDYVRLQAEDDWGKVSGLMQRSAKRLEKAGATAILLCANSMHRVYDDVAASVGIPVLHIAECIGAKMKADGITQAAIIGTRNVVTASWFRQRLVGHGVSLIPPDPDRVAEIDRIIYEELMMGQATRASERVLKTLITNIAKENVEALVLACTELVLIVDPKANILPIYDSTEIHADAAVEWILGGD